MLDLMRTFLAQQEPEYLKLHTRNMMRLELPQHSRANEAAADYVYQLLLQEGFEAEKVAFPGDGKTCYLDKIMPLSWDFSYGRLTVLSPWEGDPVLADYEKEPFALIRYSTATPEGGLVTRLVPWARMKAGEDVTGALVLLPPDLFPTDEALAPILNAGGVGLVNGTVRADASARDSTHWANNCTETNSWFVNEGERPFIGFCVTPRIRDALEEACARGPVEVKAECDGRRFPGTVWGVTASLPGASGREFWLMAHLAEPLENDNSSGVIASVTILRQIRDAVAAGKLPPLTHGIRVLFAPEMYGYAAFAHRFGDAEGVLRQRCVGALSLDGMPLSAEDQGLRMLFAPPAVPFYGNALFEGACHAYRQLERRAPFILHWGDHYGDDAHMSDASVGLPTLMPLHGAGVFWHNSTQRDGYVDYDQFARATALYGAFTAAVAAPEAALLKRFLPVAAGYAQARLAELAAQKPPRPGTCAKERMAFWTKVETDRIRDFATAGAEPAEIGKAVAAVETFAAGLTPVPADPARPAPAYEEAAGWIPARLTVGFPHDLARVPLEKRWYPLPGNILDGPMARVLSNMDGKKTLQQLYRQTEWEECAPLSDEELASYTRALRFLAEYGYVALKKA